MSETPELQPEKNLDKSTLVEAALYVSGKPVDLKTLAAVIGLRSEEKTREIARKLRALYLKEDRAIEVLELTDGRFVMQLKPHFAPQVRRLATRQLLTPGPMKTLSFIAYKQPVTQSYLARVRGNLSYGHVKHLQEMGLISEEKLGRTKMLRTTTNFADYFNLSQDLQTMKKQLEKIFSDIKSEKTPTNNIPAAATENAKLSNETTDTPTLTG